MFHIQLPTKENKYLRAWLCISFTKSALNSEKPLVESGKNGLESNFPYILVLLFSFPFSKKKRHRNKTQNTDPDKKQSRSFKREIIRC